MTAIISTTYDDQYLFYLPITTWAWNKLGVNVICFMPFHDSVSHGELALKKWDLITDFISLPGITNYAFRNKEGKICLSVRVFGANKNKEATYAQCSRLYAEGDIKDDEVLITADIDMAVFNEDYYKQFNDGRIHIVGADLVPEGQYPMCYIAMPAIKWREVMMIRKGERSQYKLDQLLGHLDCEHFRGNYWAKDQEEAYNHIHLYELVKHNRAAPGTQFATRRADRDGWPEAIPLDIIDAHLPRPGYTEENFAKILDLFQTMYPLDDFKWMQVYRNEYIKLLNS